MDELLLDTTYLLPVFGLAVELNNFQALFSRLLSTYTTIYNPASLMEAKWIVLRLTRRNPAKTKTLLEAYRTGLKALQADERLAQTDLTNEKVETLADELAPELKDYFDRMIYSTAAERNCILLSEDAELRSLWKNKRHPRPKEVLNWDAIAERRDASNP